MNKKKLLIIISAAMTMSYAVAQTSASEECLRKSRTLWSAAFLILATRSAESAALPTPWKGSEF